MLDITKCLLTLILNKRVTVLGCMKNGTLCDTVLDMYVYVRILLNPYFLDIFWNNLFPDVVSYPVQLTVG